jgi:RNA polymerase sigma-70 factor (ECF subfamily)
MDLLSDQELVRLANAGDEKAFEALYTRYREWVVSLAMRFTGDAAEAMDVLQETFLYLLSKFPGFALTSRLTTFLYPAVKNISIGLRKRRARYMGGDAALEIIEAAAEPVTSELPAVVSSLPETHREVVLMRFVDAMSLEEIATALQIPVGTVKSRLHNALATLRDDPRVQKFFER